MKRYFLILTIASVLLFPHKSQAVVDFGGYAVWSVPCVCSGGAVWYVWYAPLRIAGVLLTGAMAVGVPPTALWFSAWDPIVPTTWSLGKFMPGVQSCWQPAAHGCYPWPVLGHVYWVGSSLPGALP